MTIEVIQAVCASSLRQMQRSVQTMAPTYVCPVVLDTDTSDSGYFVAMSKGRNPAIGTLFKKPGTLHDYLALVGDWATLNLAGHHGGSSGGEYMTMILLFEKLANALSEEEGRSLAYENCLYVDGIELEDGSKRIGLYNALSEKDMQTLQKKLEASANRKLLGSSFSTSDWQRTKAEQQRIIKAATLDRDYQGYDKSFVHSLSFGYYGTDERFRNLSYQVSIDGGGLEPKSFNEMVEVLKTFLDENRGAKHLGYLDNVYSVLDFMKTGFSISELPAVLLTGIKSSARLEIKPESFIYRWIERTPTTEHLDFCGSNDKWPFVSFASPFSQT